MTKSLVDESILDGIPDELIRPLLAISIRASRPHTIPSYKQLLKDIRRLIGPCGDAGGESLYYVDVQTRVEQAMQAMLDAQAWVRKTDPAAEATSIYSDRWAVNVHSNGRNQELHVEYKPAGLTINGVRLRTVVTEVKDHEMPSA
jgi:hypothetical protein